MSLTFGARGQDKLGYDQANDKYDTLHCMVYDMA